MQRDKVFSIITIACFCTILLIPIGLALMWFQTKWKTKRKIIITSAGSLLYIAIVAFVLLLEPSYNTGGISLPFKYYGGETAYEASANPGRPSKKDKKVSPASNKKQKSDSEQSEAEEERIPRSVKKQSGRALGRGFYIFLFFVIVMILILWRNFRSAGKKDEYENPYVDTNLYKLPLADDAKMPLVHFLRLKAAQGEKILYATETVQKDNEGDFVVTDKRVVIFSKTGTTEVPLTALSAVLSVSNSVMQLTASGEEGEQKYYVFLPESQMKFALAIVKWAYSKA
ncbi:hypothetical protein SAMN04487775_11051 [Treponema bryantii]|uniref:Uncharacterized protein n=1 Tax=Treponema bryantii TaxID=163 RepID=A0A1I3MRC8_9SPIR|nr:hypothetical protein [Treponema bryantii]SFI99360.1 hypothetical protein SAMN04487775_11051 [Treponema bryantii]